MMTDSEKQGSLVSVSLPPSAPCRVIKWVAEPGGRVRKGTVLLTYSTDLSSAEPETETLLKSTVVGVVKERLVEEGEIVRPGYVYELKWFINYQGLYMQHLDPCTCWYNFGIKNYMYMYVYVQTVCIYMYNIALQQSNAHYLTVASTIIDFVTHSAL